ncbi:alpha/beta hydrolase family protein [Mesonia aquimarina]|uniref:alpha/beta hydrolase family protein n=1 Tax=Mesonia aquimarina TaxID=1504967 RepID=UPI000EF60BF0|nr:alpha/beta hydrolase [Mesonia aquimarina]
MKTRLTLIFIFFSTILFAQNIEGDWSGDIQVQGTKIGFTFTIKKEGDQYSSVVDIPKQGVKDLPVTSTTFKDSILNLSIVNAGITYEGKYKNNAFVGDFKQAGLSLPLTLTPGEKKLNRPQEPKKPFPYTSENITVKNEKAGITLAATLTLPENVKKAPAVILISGSGPQNRDSEILGHKPFLLLSDYLTKNGFAVLRFDERGVGESEGTFSTATSYDFADDVESFFNYLETRKDIDSENIGLIGHSEGGSVAPIIAARNKNVAFIVLMAGAGVEGSDLLLSQKKAMQEKLGVDAETIEKSQQQLGKAYQMIVNSTENNEAFQQKLTNYLDENFDEVQTKSQAQSLAQQLTSPWMYNFIRYNPESILEKVNCPVLAINGSNDLQVPAKENLAAIKTVLTENGNKKVTTREIEKLNHLFQESKTGLPNEYAEIEQTISPVALRIVSDWLLRTTSN